jgi:DNA-binding NarL/FixJ family response regulator
MGSSGRLSTGAQAAAPADQESAPFDAAAGPDPDRDPTRTDRDGHIRLFLLDDHEVVRRGIKGVFEDEHDIDVVGESGSAVDAATRIPGLRPHVALLDGRLEDGSGVEVCRSIRSVDPSINAIILTSYDDDEALFAAIMAGAAGYLLKRINGLDLVDAVRKVAAGQSLLDPSVTQRVLDRVRSGGASLPPELQSLTERERTILACIAEGKTNRQIGLDLHLAEKTVKNYVTTILGKLGMRSRTQAAVLAAKLLD